MKYLFIIFLLFPLLSYSQNENKIFIGAEVGLYNYSHIRADFEHHLVGGKYILQLGYATDLDEHLLQLKVGFRLFKIEPWKTRFYLYFPPYLNMNLAQGGRYNTPICFELMKDWKLGNTFTLYSSINTDVFVYQTESVIKSTWVPQIKFRIKLFSWKKEEK